MTKRKKAPPADLTVGERLTLEILRQEARMSCDELLVRSGRKWRQNLVRDLRYLAAVGAVQAETDPNGTERYSLAAGRA